jgi:hypothetical protein
LDALARLQCLPSLIVACSLLPKPNEPADAVRAAVAGTVAHDLGAAASHVCPERRGDGPLAFVFGLIVGASIEIVVLITAVAFVPGLMFYCFMLDLIHDQASLR